MFFLIKRLVLTKFKSFFFFFLGGGGEMILLLLLFSSLWRKFEIWISEKLLFVIGRLRNFVTYLSTGSVVGLGVRV